MANVYAILLNDDQLVEHACTAYCRGGLHAVDFLTGDDDTAEDVTTTATALGFDVAEVFPAREADVEALRNDRVMGRGRITGALQPLPLAARQALTQAWIILCRNEPWEVEDV